MMLLSSVAGVLLALMLCLAVWNLLAATRLERAGSLPSPPSASLLIPARNEAHNLAINLATMLRIEHPDLEILVLDDESEDGTAAVVEAHRRDHGERLRLLRGSPLPEGWLGKSWACHQLSRAARGEVLVFCDADVSVGPVALTRTLAAMERTGAGLLTALPRQRLGSWIERSVVPLVAHLAVMALLPLQLVSRLRAPALSMGNGQWLAFTRLAYDACGGHAAVRGEVVEDVALARRTKAAGQRVIVVVATSLLEVRMYRNAGDLRDGFGKNLYALVGGRPLPFVAALTVFLLAAVYPWAGALLGAPGALGLLVLLLALRGCGMLLLRHDLRSVLLHPLGSLLLVGLALRSCAGAWQGTNRWKGRRISPRPALGEDSAARERRIPWALLR